MQIKKNKSVRHYELVLFDLDGTLLNTSPGIYNSVRYAEKKMGFTRISDNRLREFLGPPPKTMYRKIYEVDEDTAILAAKYHRKYGREKAIFEASVYPQIHETLIMLREKKYKLGVATLKSQQIAETILKLYDLFSYFDCIVGMDDKEYFTKADTVRQAMRLVNANSAVLVGDSIYDYNGATEANIDFIGALYGFGLKSSNEEYLTINSPIELSILL